MCHDNTRRNMQRVALRDAMYFWKNESSLNPVGAFFPLRPGRFNGMDFTMYAVDMRDTILKRESAFE